MTTPTDHLAAATAHLTALEGDTPKLAALREEHARNAEAVRQQVRAGTGTFDDLVTVEGKLAAASNLLEQHAQEVAEAQAQAEALAVRVTRAQDAERLAVLGSDLAANLDRRHQLAGQFIQGMEDGLSALIVNATACRELAAEAAAVTDRLGQRVPYEISQHLGHYASGAVHDHLMQQLNGTGGPLAEAMRDTLRDGLRRVLDTLQAGMERQATA